MSCSTSRKYHKILEEFIKNFQIVRGILFLAAENLAKASIIFHVFYTQEEGSIKRLMSQSGILK